MFFLQFQLYQRPWLSHGRGRAALEDIQAYICQNRADIAQGNTICYMSPTWGPEQGAASPLPLPRALWVSPYQLCTISSHLHHCSLLGTWGRDAHPHHICGASEGTEATAGEQPLTSGNPDQTSSPRSREAVKHVFSLTGYNFSTNNYLSLR